MANCFLCGVCGLLRDSAELAEGVCHSSVVCGFGGKSAALSKAGCLYGEATVRGSTQERIGRGGTSENHWSEWC